PMKRLVMLAVVLAIAVGALYLAQHRRADAEVSPDALLHFVGDTQRELTRLPASATRLSDNEEIRFGQELVPRVVAEEEANQHHDSDRDVVQQYLNRVGGRLAAHAHRKLPYSFHYIRDPHFVNAFALPGGPVFIGAGLMSLMDSEDELASVLGHEIEHIDHYHCAERVQQQEALHQIPLGGLLSLPIEVFAVGYSKDQELEADREGTRLSIQAGYSPNGAIRMFETFQRLYQEYHVKSRTPQGEITQTALDTLEGYF